MMKKLLAMLLVLLLPLTAMAVTVTQLPEEAFTLMGGGLVMGMDYEEDLYWLMNAAGEAVSDRYVDISNSYEWPLAEVEISEELNAKGLINSATGEVVVPAKYGDVEILSDRWCVCAVLMPTDDADAPYYDWSGNHYAIATTDVYYCGTQVAALTADESGDYEAYGAYLSVMNDHHVIWLDAAGARRVYERSYDASDEFAEDYDAEVITHNGSGQQAFTAGCTLTADDVSQPYHMTDAGLIDLQGNVLIAADALPGDAYLRDFCGEYVSMNCYIREVSEFYYGVMRLDGTVVVPFTASAVPVDNLFAYGVLPVIMPDGQLCYYDETGAVVASMPMPEGATKYDVDGFTHSSPVLLVKVDDVCTVLSAAAGVLDVSAYDEVRLLGTAGAMAVKQGDKWGVLDAAGTQVIPCELDGVPDISLDNTLVLGEVYDREAGCLVYLYNLAE